MRAVGRLYIFSPFPRHPSSQNEGLARLTSGEGRDLDDWRRRQVHWPPRRHSGRRSRGGPPGRHLGLEQRPARRFGLAGQHASTDVKERPLRPAAVLRASTLAEVDRHRLRLGVVLHHFLAHLPAPVRLLEAAEGLLKPPSVARPRPGTAEFPSPKPRRRWAWPACAPDRLSRWDRRRGRSEASPASSSGQ